MSATAPSAGDGAPQLSVLRDVNLELTVELGRTTRPLKDVLHLAPGEVVVLDRPAGAPADLYVNGALFARGQIVEAVETGEYAIRVTEVVAPAAPNASSPPA
jgi:flagellar motor switch protein FliN/FliY